MKRVVIALTAVSMLGGCGVFGGKDKAKTPTIGERVPVLAAESRVEVDPALADVPIALPAVQANADWAQPGGNAAKSMSHVALGASLGRAWIASIGNGSEPRQRLASGPVVAAGRVYTIDTQAVARAFDATSGRPVWAREVGDAKERRGSISILTGESKGAHGLLFGGGVAFDNGRIYATSGLGDVEAIDAARTISCSRSIRSTARCAGLRRVRSKWPGCSAQPPRLRRRAPSWRAFRRAS